MSGQTTQNCEYCAILVRARDEDRWLAARYAEPEPRRILMALYAFHGELRRIPASVSEPPLGEIRLQWWRESLTELRESKAPHTHPVVSELACAGLGSADFEQQIHKMIDAAARPLYGEGFAQIADLADWLARIDGALDSVAVLVLGGDIKLADVAMRAGTGFALAREGRHWAPLLKSEVVQRAQAIAAETAPALRMASANLSPAMLHLALTKSYALRNTTAFPLAKRLRLFSAMAARRF